CHCGAAKHLHVCRCSRNRRSNKSEQCRTACILPSGKILRLRERFASLSIHLGVQLDLEPLPVEPAHATKIAIYRCAQECISNVIRHSGATRFAMSLAACDSILELRIEE